MQARAVQPPNEESEKSGSKLIKSHSNPAVILNSHEIAFNKMSFLVVSKITIPRINSV